MSAAIPVSDELRASVARMCVSPRGDLAAAYEAGEVETKAASLHIGGVRPLHRRESWRHLELGKRRPQRSPDRQRSYERRHRLAYSGPLPSHLAGRLTIGEMAVARIIADAHRRRKFCDMSLGEIAARAGVCRKTAKRAMRQMRGLALITIEERPVKGRKSLTNVVKIVSREWLSWLDKRPKPAGATSIGGHLVAPTNTNKKDKREVANNKEERNAGELGRHQRAGPSADWCARRDPFQDAFAKLKSSIFGDER